MLHGSERSRLFRRYIFGIGGSVTANSLHLHFHSHVIIAEPLVLLFFLPLFPQELYTCEGSRGRSRLRCRSITWNGSGEFLGAASRHRQGEAVEARKRWWDRERKWHRA